MQGGNDEAEGAAGALINNLKTRINTMKLEGLNNEYRSEDGEVKKIIPLGYVGSEDLYNTAKERLGIDKLYYISDDGWNREASGRYPNTFYGIEEWDYHLFESYNHLEEGWEMIGYGDDSVVESGYEYLFHDARVNEFFKSPHQNLNTGHIYARRKKEGKPSNELELTDASPDKMYIPLKIATYEKLENICSKEEKTISDKINEWVDADKEQKKAKRSRAEVMKDIKKELEDAWSEEEAPGEMVKGAEFLLDLITEGGMKFK